MIHSEIVSFIYKPKSKVQYLQVKQRDLYINSGNPWINKLVSFTQPILNDGAKIQKLAIQDREKNGRHWNHCARFLGMSSLIKFWFCCLSMTSWSSFLSILWICPLGNFFFSMILHGHIWDECWAFTFFGCHAALYPTVCF